MKKVMLLLSFLTISMLGFSQTITYEDNFGMVTLNSAAQVNGKNAYVGDDGAFTISVIWSGSRWEIYIFNGVTSTPGTGDLSFSNTFASTPNPPDFNTGTWVDEAADGTSLLGFSGSGTQAFLPVELTAFRALPTKGGMKLVWSTATEIDNLGFELQRSLNGKTFNKLSWLDGQGTTVEAQSYSYEDKTATQNATYYYRLKQVDTDGSFTYSDVVTASLNGDKSVATFSPNPVQEGFTQLNYTTPKAGELTVRVFDASGKELWQQVQQTLLGANTLDLDINNLAKGMYFVKLEQGTYQTYEKLIVK